jgi:hypothetical protein
MSITYQQAKRIRNTGLMSLFADQLMYEKKISTAIKKTVSLKTRGAVMGITQKFDPLNIAKILTFGSALGPAMLGHLMGRDPRDIQYFTGRFKPIREKTKTADKITKLPGGSIGDEGMSVVLRKMYRLMAANQADNIKRKELAKNREEELALEDEKRHKELIEALSNLSGTGTATIIKEPTKESPGIMGMIGGVIENIKKWVEDFVKNFDFMEIVKKVIGSGFSMLLRFLASPIFALLMGPLIGIGTILGLAELLKFGVAQVENRNVVSPEEARNILENAQYKSDLERFGGEEKLKDIITNGPKRAAEILERGDTKEINDAGGRDFLEKVKKQTNVVVPQTNLTVVQQVPARPDTTGGKNKQRAAAWDRKFGDNFDVTGAPKVQDQSFDKAESAKLLRQSESKMSMPIDNSGSKLNVSQNENLKGKIAYGTIQRKSETTQVNNATVNKQVDKTTPVKRPVPTIRNQEPTFSDLMFSNTRPAN